MIFTGINMKICHLIFSCNRLKYLIPTLESGKKIDFGEHEVYKILVDDYPRTRNNNIFNLLKDTYDIDELVLNPENKGLSKNWTDTWEKLKGYNFDYIFHQEDDVIINEPIKIDDLIELLSTDEKMVQVVLQRQKWYSTEEDMCVVNPTDTPFKDYLYFKDTDVFSPISSLYSTSLLNEGYIDYYGFNLNEGMIMVYLNWLYESYSAHLKGNDGRNLITHIGEEFTGRRLLEGEPNFEKLNYDPNKMYSSRNGDELKGFI